MSADGAPDAAGFDARPAQVHAGTDLIVRLPGLLALIRRDPAHHTHVNELLESLRTASATASAPGARLARQLSLWLAGNDDPPPFGTLAATDDGIAVFLHGAVRLTSGDGAVALRGSEAAFAVDRVLPAWSGELLLAGDDASPAEESTLPAWAGLQQGVAIGGSVTLGSRSTAEQIPSDQPPPADVPGAVDQAMPDTPVMSDAVDEQPVPDDAAVVSGAVVEPPVPDAAIPAPAGTSSEAASAAAPRLVERIQGAEPEPPRAPLPLAGSAPVSSSRERQREAAQGSTERPGAYVKGFRCSRGHLNDPRVSFCRQCGIRMDHVTGILTFERRPPLGLIVLDAGASFVLDDNYILGRTPQTAAEVRSGAYRPIQIDDRTGSLSRVHAEIRLEDWDALLIDRRSANGTFVAGPDRAGGYLPWTRLAPGQKFLLTPGTQVQLGRRRFVFESSAARF